MPNSPSYSYFSFEALAQKITSIFFFFKSLLIGNGDLACLLCWVLCKISIIEKVNVGVSTEEELLGRGIEEDMDKVMAGRRRRR